MDIYITIGEQEAILRIVLQFLPLHQGTRNVQRLNCGNMHSTTVCIFRHMFHLSWCHGDDRFGLHIAG